MLLLHIKNLSVVIEEKKIISQLNLEIQSSEVHAIMGQNGSGKSSLAYAVMGHPRYAIFSGDIHFLGQNITNMAPDKRARQGVFLAFQHPFEIPGATVFSVLKEAYVAVTGKLVTISSFSNMLYEKMDLLQIDRSFAGRNLNEGFSGGEKKRVEILQMLILKPKLALLDEIDSGLDVDSIKVVANGIRTLKAENPGMSLLIITHHQHILRHIQPDVVHVMHDGKIVKKGDSMLAQKIEQYGYSGLLHG